MSGEPVRLDPQILVPPFGNMAKPPSKSGISLIFLAYLEANLVDKILMYPVEQYP